MDAFVLIGWVALGAVVLGSIGIGGIYVYKRYVITADDKAREELGGSRLD